MKRNNIETRILEKVRDEIRRVVDELVTARTDEIREAMESKRGRSFRDQIKKKDSNNGK